MLELTITLIFLRNSAGVSPADEDFPASSFPFRMDSDEGTSTNITCGIHMRLSFGMADQIPSKNIQRGRVGLFERGAQRTAEILS